MFTDTEPRELTPRQYAAVQELRHAALWYAWGRADERAEHIAGANLVDAWRFADHYATLAELYATEQVGFRPSIRDALATFIAEQVAP